MNKKLRENSEKVKKSATIHGILSNFTFSSNNTHYVHGDVLVDFRSSYVQKAEEKVKDGMLMKSPVDSGHTFKKSDKMPAPPSTPVSFITQPSPQPISRRHNINIYNGFPSSGLYLYKDQT